MVCALLSTGNERNWPTFKWQNGRSVRRSQGRRGPSKRQNVTVYICGMPCLNQVIGTQICPPRINRLRWNPGCKLQRWGYTAVLCCDALLLPPSTSGPNSKPELKCSSESVPPLRVVASTHSCATSAIHRHRQARGRGSGLVLALVE